MTSVVKVRNETAVGKSAPELLRGLEQLARVLKMCSDGAQAIDKADRADAQFSALSMTYGIFSRS